MPKYYHNLVVFTVILKSHRDEIAKIEGEEVVRKCEYNIQGTDLGNGSRKKNSGEH